MIFMGVAGATVAALTPSEKKTSDRIISWFVGVILCAALSSHTANFLTAGNYVEVFGFIYGMGGLTLAKIFLKAIERKAEEKTGVKIDDDSN